MPLKILVTGANGQLGNELRRILDSRFPGQALYTDIDSLDLTDSHAVENFITGGDFSHIINCAAYTAVDKAEEEPAACTAVNVEAVKNIGRAANRSGIHVVHISTDFVFDGKQSTPYTESDKTNPLSQYGVSKRKSETALLGYVPDAIIIRTGWLYSSFGKNFVKTILRKALAGDKLRVVCDQIGTPTYAADLADAIVRIVTAPRWLPGLYNYSNEGVASWYDFAMAIADLSRTDANISPCMTSGYPSPATRPHFSVLDKSKIKATFGLSIPYWRSALKRCLNEIDKESL